MALRHTLYQYDTCPFCARVKNFLGSRGIEVPCKDTMRDPQAFRELLLGGGRPTVPCLRIEEHGGGNNNGSVRWMYESADIMAYFASGAHTG